MNSSIQQGVYDWLDTNGSNYAGPAYAFGAYNQYDPNSTIFKSDFYNWYNDWTANRAQANSTPETTTPKPEDPPVAPNIRYAIEYGPNGEVWLVEYSGGGGIDKVTGGGIKASRRVVKDYTDMYKDVKNLPGLYDERGLTNFDTWLATSGDGTRTLGSTELQMALLEDLRLRLQGTDADNAAAWESAAGGMGLTGDQLTNIMGDLTLTISGKNPATANMTPQELSDYFAANPDEQKGIIGSQQGLSPEELALRERIARNSSRETAKSFQKMLDNSLGSSNSRAKYLMQADEYLSQIRDQDLKQQLAISDEDASRRLQEYQASLQTWGSMYQAGQMGKEQFLSNIRQNRSMEMQVVATEISTIMAENQQYLQMYAADLGALNSYIQTQFTAIQTEMGMDTALLDMTAELYAQAMAPFYTQLAEWQAQMDVYTAGQTQQALDMQQQQQEWAQTQAETDTGVAIFTGILGFAGTILGSLLGAPWLGALLAGVTGAATSGSGYSGYTYQGGNANAIAGSAGR